MYIYTFGLQSAFERTGSHTSCEFVYISIVKNSYLLEKCTTFIQATKIVKILSEADFPSVECKICEIQAHLVEFKHIFMYYGSQSIQFNNQWMSSY